METVGIVIGGLIITASLLMNAKIKKIKAAKLREQLVLELSDLEPSTTTGLETMNKMGRKDLEILHEVILLNYCKALETWGGARIGLHINKMKSVLSDDKKIDLLISIFKTAIFKMPIEKLSDIYFALIIEKVSNPRNFTKNMMIAYTIIPETLLMAGQGSSGSKTFLKLIDDKVSQFKNLSRLIIEESVKIHKLLE